MTAADRVIRRTTAGAVAGVAATERMGHSSTRAALIYLHATRERDEAIAAGMGQLFTNAKKTATKPNRSGMRPPTRPLKIKKN